MVQLVVGLLHRREQGSAQRLSPVCQRWYSRSSDGVIKTHSTKHNAHDHRYQLNERERESVCVGGGEDRDRFRFYCFS